MAPRPSWHGYLKLSLVTCPVAMLPATSEKAAPARFGICSLSGRPSLWRARSIVHPSWECKCKNTASRTVSRISGSDEQFIT
jgi:hypothetical protein